jgi:hypothetical protein
MRKKSGSELKRRQIAFAKLVLMLNPNPRDANPERRQPKDEFHKDAMRQAYFTGTSTRHEQFHSIGEQEDVSSKRLER